MSTIRHSHIIRKEKRFGTPDRFDGSENFEDISSTDINRIIGDNDPHNFLIISRMTSSGGRFGGTRRFLRFTEDVIASAELLHKIDSSTDLIEVYDNDNLVEGFLNAGAQLLADEQTLHEEALSRFPHARWMYNTEQKNNPRAFSFSNIMTTDSFDFRFANTGIRIDLNVPPPSKTLEEAARFEYYTVADETARSLCMLLYRATRSDRLSQDQIVGGIEAFSLGILPPLPLDDVEEFALQFDKLSSLGELAAKHISKNHLYSNEHYVQATANAVIARDLLRIWTHAFSIGVVSIEERDAVRQAGKEAASNSDDQSRAYIEGVARFLGVDEMLDAYFDSVSLEHIVSGEWRDISHLLR